MKDRQHYGYDPETGEEYFHLTLTEVIIILSIIILGAVLDVFMLLILLGKLKILGLG